MHGRNGSSELFKLKILMVDIMKFFGQNVQILKNEKSKKDK